MIGQSGKKLIRDKKEQYKGSMEKRFGSLKI
jgi:hypothetical protein